MLVRGVRWAALGTVEKVGVNGRFEELHDRVHEARLVLLFVLLKHGGYHLRCISVSGMKMLISFSAGRSESGRYARLA